MWVCRCVRRLPWKINGRDKLQIYSVVYRRWYASLRRSLNLIDAAHTSNLLVDCHNFIVDCHEKVISRNLTFLQSFTSECDHMCW